MKLGCLGKFETKNVNVVAESRLVPVSILRIIIIIIIIRLANYSIAYFVPALQVVHDDSLCDFFCHNILFYSFFIYSYSPKIPWARHDINDPPKPLSKRVRRRAC